MRYYSVKTVIATDGTENRDMRGFDSKDEADVRFHTDLASAIGKDTTKKITMMVIDEDGVTLKSETWAKSEDTDTSI